MVKYYYSSDLDTSLNLNSLSKLNSLHLSSIMSLPLAVKPTIFINRRRAKIPAWILDDKNIKANKLVDKNEIPLPTKKNPEMKDMSMMPYISKKTMENLEQSYDVSKPIIFSLLGVFFLLTSLIGIYSTELFLFGITMVGLSVSNFVFQFRQHRRLAALDDKNRIEKEKSSLDTAHTKIIEKLMAAEYPDVSFENTTTSAPVQAMNVFRAHIVADRPSSEIVPTGTRVNSDSAAVDQLAADALVELKISSSDFSQYQLNFKAFVARNIIQKLVQMLHQEDPLTESMVSIPNFEHHRQYVIERIKSLGTSQFLAGHFGDRGDRFRDREWSEEMPSDNQIVLHIIGTWLSFFMGSKSTTKRIQNIFCQKYISRGAEPKLDEKRPFVLCIDKNNHYYVLKLEKGGYHHYYAFPGHDALYAGLTLFFYFVKTEQAFNIEGADLLVHPICMDRVFSTTRI